MTSQTVGSLSRSACALRLVLTLALGAALAACAPQNTGNTYGASSLGRVAAVSYGTIVGSRPVQLQGGAGGVGTAAGALAGGVGGSFIGGDWRSNLLAGLGGAVIGGLAGNAIEQGAGSRQAIEFVVREDRGGDIAVVQTNEDGLQVGDRVVVNRGDRTRLSRAAGGAPPSAAYLPPPDAMQPNYSSVQPRDTLEPVGANAGGYSLKR